jgi:hypothetical protein
MALKGHVLGIHAFSASSVALFAAKCFGTDALTLTFVR